MRKKCKNCRKVKRNMDTTPKRPPRGSIRKAKRQEMRAQKKRRMTEMRAAEEKANREPAVTYEINVEDSMRDVEGTSNIMKQTKSRPFGRDFVCFMLTNINQIGISSMLHTLLL